MAQYKVVFVTEPNLAKAGIKQLAAWTAAGGRLVLSGGAAMADEYNSTDDTLPLLTGCSLNPFPRRLLRVAPQLPGPAQLPFAANGSIGTKRVTMYGDKSGFTKLQAGSKTLGHFDGGAASTVETRVGGGSIVQMAWMPGFSYLINATHDDYVPNPVTQFPAAIREFLQGFVEAAPSPVSLTDSDGKHVVGVETVLMSSDAGAVVTVINWGGVRLSGPLLLTLNLAAVGLAQIGHVSDASSGKMIYQVAKNETAATVAITAEHANFIIFHRAEVGSIQDFKSDDEVFVRGPKDVFAHYMVSTLCNSW